MFITREDLSITIYRAFFLDVQVTDFFLNANSVEKKLGGGRGEEEEVLPPFHSFISLCFRLDWSYYENDRQILTMKRTLHSAKEA